MIGLLASAAIGLGGNIFSGIFGAKAAKKAANVQVEAARRAGQRVEDITRETNPAIIEAARRAGVNVSEAAGTAATDVRSEAERAATGVDAATGQANKLLDPYAQFGAESTEELRRNLIPGGAFNRQPTMEDIQIDPGYAFRLQQGQQTIERSAAARGGAMGGAALKDLTTFAQGTAAQEYSNAFNRYRTNTQDQFDRLFGASGRGQDAAGLQGQNLIGGSRYGGDARMQAGQFGAGLTTDAARFGAGVDVDAVNQTSQNTINAMLARAGFDTDAAAAEAGGIIGRSNAITGAVSGGANTAMQHLALWEATQNPARNLIQPPSWSEPIAGRYGGTRYSPTAWKPGTLPRRG